MSGSVSSAGGLLGILFGASTTGGPAAGNPIIALKLAEKNQTKQIAATAAKPQVQRDIAAFRAAVKNAKDPKSLLSNPAFMKVLLTANGLGDQLAYTALARKAMLSDTTKMSSLVNTLSDTRWKAAAETYDFANKGLSVIRASKVLDTLADGYAEVNWRRSLDQTTPGLSNALDFRSRASSIKSVYQILGDATLRAVVTTALDLPPQIAFQSLTAQERAIHLRVDITKFQDTKFVDQFTSRYLLKMADTASVAQSTDLALLALQTRGLVV